MGKKIWTRADIPSLTGKLALVTGGYGGLGYETVLALTKAGATVIIAGRSEEKAKEAIDKILELCPEAKLEFVRVDQCSLESIAEFAAIISKKYPCLDILVNNAAAPMPPQRETTKDGFEIQFGVNHLSHFAMVAHLLPLLRRSSAPRVVSVSSLTHRKGAINFEDLQSENCAYNWRVYAQSKLANLLFAFELQRRSDAGGWGIKSVSAHPGYSITPRTSGSWIRRWIVNPLAGQYADAGALPQIFAATAVEAEGGGYYGPDGFYEVKGNVAPAWIAPNALDKDLADKLWQVSINLTGAVWP